MDTGTLAILGQLRVALKQHGARCVEGGVRVRSATARAHRRVCLLSGIIGLGRKFKIMDDNRDGCLDLGEFKKAMKECDLSLDDRVRPLGLGAVGHARRNATAPA